MKASRKFFVFLTLILVSSLLTYDPVFSARTKRYKTNRNYLQKSSKIVRFKEKSTDQEFIFLGCPGNEENFKDVVQVLASTQRAWNSHQIDELLKYYAPNFLTKDGLNLNKISKNLSSFWFEYTDAKIKSYPSTIQVCGNLATVNLSEITTATGQIESTDIMPYPPKFKGWVQGVTTLKKIGNNWKITSEEILSEQMWKYYGNKAEELLDQGNIELSIPLPVQENENYIVQLNHSLPNNVQGVALIDKILLTEFPETEKEEKTKKKQKKKEIESIRRSIDWRKDKSSLRRLFTANNLGQDELVRAQIELISFKEKGPSLLGIIGISQRVIPKPIPQQNSTVKIQITSTFKEEAIKNKTIKERSNKG
ncbi:MAG: hypothetical protein QNJ31_00185 [Candidatus Caenarcaniphilales bacterium]|nr:hypothetical protein [Candidatus Caenarcaniphilales bacterium]